MDSSQEGVWGGGQMEGGGVREGSIARRKITTVGEGRKEGERMVPQT